MTEPITSGLEIVIVRVDEDDYGTFQYSFTCRGLRFECFDFDSSEDAFAGAEFHLKCLWENLPHEISDGLGPIYRPDWLPMIP